MNILVFENVRIKKVKKPQVKEVIFYSKLAKELDKEEIRDLKDKFVFVILPRWLVKEKGFSSCRLYGRVTRVSRKGFQLNFSEWFPISQIKHLFIHQKSKQSDMLKFVEGWNNENRL